MISARTGLPDGFSAGIDEDGAFRVRQINAVFVPGFLYAADIARKSS